MLSRREFFKTGALGAAALALGAGFGRWTALASRRELALEAWLPADPAWVARLLNGVSLDIGQVDGPPALASRLATDLRPGGARLLVEERPAPAADFALLEDGRLLDPVLDWQPAWRALRAELAGREAAWRVALLPRSGTGRATGLALTRWDGRREELALDGDGRIERLGRGGRPWTLALDAGTLRVVEAGCRHGLCRAQGAVSLPGSRIACAPAGWTAELLA